MIVKPIFIIRLADNTSEYEIENMQANVKERFPDLEDQYHVMWCHSSCNDYVEFECYNANSIPIEEQKRTKGLILDIISKINSQHASNS